MPTTAPLTDDEDDDAERPDDCDCIATMTDLGCWPCWRAGFELPNPDAPPREDDDT